MLFLQKVPQMYQVTAGAALRSPKHFSTSFIIGWALSLNNQYRPGSECTALGKLWDLGCLRQVKVRLPGEGRGRLRGVWGCGDRKTQSHSFVPVRPWPENPRTGERIAFIMGLCMVWFLIAVFCLIVVFYSINLDERLTVLPDPAPITGDRKRQNIGSLLSRNPTSNQKQESD